MSTSNAAAVVSGWPAETAPFRPITGGRAAALITEPTKTVMINAAKTPATREAGRGMVLISLSSGECD
jgi:hypothetical protein